MLADRNPWLLKDSAAAVSFALFAGFLNMYAEKSL
jgi:hypothetical protein